MIPCITVAVDANYDGLEDVISNKTGVFGICPVI